MGADSGTGPRKSSLWKGLLAACAAGNGGAPVGGAEFDDRKLRRVASDLTSHQAGPELG